MGFGPDFLLFGPRDEGAVDRLELRGELWGPLTDSCLGVVPYNGSLNTPTSLGLHRADVYGNMVTLSR